MERENLTIMFTDMAGFTEKTSRQSRDTTIAMVRRHRDLIGVLMKYR